ncbi:sugar diacid recognition domain-containing protein [Nonomuraea sp. NPDC052116]|uniref:CdaR family transcriptional regulator n=1 Tax=Nonomuraea sp. NPDC052116 TaxID=3155665 RepID=UPI0034295435
MAMSGHGWPPILTPALAQGIAGDTSDIIGFNVLITDRDGMVIGSGDSSRLGSFHEASVEVMRTLESAAHSGDQARRLRGVRPGITLPIVIDGRAVGTVGITGSPAQVKRFGLVVKRQTEILLQESMLLRSRLMRERTMEDLLRDIMQFDPDVADPDELLARAQELGFDLGRSHTVVLIEISGQGDGTDSRPGLLRVIREVFSGPQDLVASVAGGRYAALRRTLTPGDLRPLADRVADRLRQRSGLQARIGIGVSAASIPELHASFADAAAALRLGPRVRPGSPVHAIDELRVHQVLAAAPATARLRLAEVFTAELRARPEWPALRQTIIAFCENGFNLVQAASALNIHRNTLLYRLDKIAALTGHGGDDQVARLGMYLACVADQVDRPT